MFKKISHNRLKNIQNLTKMLCGAPNIRRFLMLPSHFSKIIFEKRLFRQFQRFALDACGWDEILFGSRKISKPENYLKMAQKPANPLHALLLEYSGKGRGGVSLERQTHRGAPGCEHQGRPLPPMREK
jgi:hypothetical protein